MFQQELVDERLVPDAAAFGLGLGPGQRARVQFKVDVAILEMRRLRRPAELRRLFPKRVSIRLDEAFVLFGCHAPHSSEVGIG